MLDARAQGLVGSDEVMLLYRNVYNALVELLNSMKQPGFAARFESVQDAVSDLEDAISRELSPPRKAWYRRVKLPWYGVAPTRRPE